MPIRLAFISLVAASLLQAQAAPKPLANEFPFEYREGMIWIMVHTRKSAEPLNYLLDSGAGASVINLRTAQRLGLKLANRVEVQGVGSTTTGYWPQRLSATVGGTSMPKRYVAVDLDNLSGACHCRVDGLLGTDFFRDRTVQIDFQAQKVRFLATAAPMTGKEVLPMKNSRGAFLAPIKVNGKETKWMRVDTGCASALQWVTKAAPSDTCSRRVAIALKEISLDTVKASVSIGKIEIPSVSAELHTQPIFAGEDGLLGNGILSRFRTVTIDARTGKIAFDPVSGN